MRFRITVDMLVEGDDIDDTVSLLAVNLRRRYRGEVVLAGSDMRAISVEPATASDEERADGFEAAYRTGARAHASGLSYHQSGPPSIDPSSRAAWQSGWRDSASGAIVSDDSNAPARTPRAFD
jgi:ribosome modulation factor